jgi:N-acetylmuramoyl-L-alanine amidase
MKNLFILFILCCSGFSAQKNIEACRQRFYKYLNFRGSVNGAVKFEKDVLFLTSGGTKRVAFYEDEIPLIASYFENSGVNEQDEFLRKKGLRKFTKSQLDSLKKTIPPPYAAGGSGVLPLKEVRIAIDPGHFGTTLEEAKVEQKYLFFPGSNDTVKLFESALTFNTATILRSMLEEQGATVMMTRNQANHTSFGSTFFDWLKNDKKRTLDSLRSAGQLTPSRYNLLMKAQPYNFFWDFFRDYDLGNRAKKINEFHPHVTVIIHYNVDEKNVPWTTHTKKNFTMAFIGGAFTSDNLERSEGRVNFVRLLLSDQLDRSQKLAKQTVFNFNRNLGIEIARPEDADYLKSNCLTTSSPGVFCRNLALCRKINSPLVYGESLYQDNEKESYLLMRSDLDKYGIKTNERLHKVALSYDQAVLEFLKD